jgi:hypothetical protein
MTARSQPLKLLARSAAAMSTSLDRATHVLPTRPTPFTRWDLGTLISHVSDSVEQLIRSIGGTLGSSDDPDCRARARDGIRQLLLALPCAPRDHPYIELAALTGAFELAALTGAFELAALTGAFELAIHACDIAQSTRSPQPLPGDLVSTLLSLAPVVLGDFDRDGLFDPSYPPTPRQITDLDRLLALFGRQRRETA